MTSQSTVYKYCIVPQCTNTSISTPNKIFICVPRGEKARRIWCNAMKRDSKKNKPLSSISMRHCCEDHFELENDMENYLRWKMMGGAIKLKSGIVPHIFDCQRPTTVKPKRNAAAKRHHMSLVQEALNTPQPSASTTDCGSSNIEINPIDTSESETFSGSNESRPKNKKIQVRKKDFQASKKTQTDLLCKKSVTSTACSPMKLKVSHAKTSPIKANMLKSMTDSETSSCKEDTHSAGEMWSNASLLIIKKKKKKKNTSEYEDDACTYETCDDEDTDENFKFYMAQGTIMSIEKDPKLYLGIPKDSYFCLKMLADKIKVPILDIFITLKKIRLDEPYTILGTQFGRSSRNIGQIFKRTVPKVSIFLREFIVWPDKSKVAQCLPIAFRSRYSNVQSIIDCFETQILKPSNPLHQSLTWSEYKGCNTIKYMISCTPDGLINFVSCGFGGRASDTAIFENCGFINNLSPGMDVMADRGFKNISNILHQQQCRLIRPPSVSANAKSTKEEVLELKRIASLRIHVERVIGRLRDFNMIAPHACVDLRYLSIYDEIVIIVCGLINMQSSLIKF